MGSDITYDTFFEYCEAFLSTLPAWGATWIVKEYGRGKLHFYPRSPRGERLEILLMAKQTIRNFYPRSPRGERRKQLQRRLVQVLISIHAPRVGSDEIDSGMATTMKISIHAPRVGSDDSQRETPKIMGDFYPRSPRGERRASSCSGGLSKC